LAAILSAPEIAAIPASIISRLFFISLGQHFFYIFKCIGYSLLLVFRILSTSPSILQMFRTPELQQIRILTKILLISENQCLYMTTGTASSPGIGFPDIIESPSSTDYPVIQMNFPFPLASLLIPCPRTFAKSFSSSTTRVPSLRCEHSQPSNIPAARSSTFLKLRTSGSGTRIAAGCMPEAGENLSSASLTLQEISFSPQEIPPCYSAYSDILQRQKPLSDMDGTFR
jgi:hypothetical protein